MTAKEFAERMGVHYRTALNWLRNGLVPDAEEKPLPIGGTYWEIPQAALKMEKPKRGPEKGFKAKKSSKKGSAK